MGMSQPGRRMLPVALGVVAVVVVFAALTMAGASAVDVVCNVGSDVDQPAYERCIAELPATQAKHDEGVRFGSVARPVVALTGGLLVVLVVHLLTGSRARKPAPVVDD